MGNILDQTAQLRDDSLAAVMQDSTAGFQDSHGCSSLGSEPVDVFSSDNSRLKLHLPGKVLKKSKVRSGKLPATHANANLKRNIVDQAAQLGHKSPADAVQNSTGCSSLGCTLLDIVDNGTRRSKPCLPGDIWKSQLKSRKIPATHAKANMKSSTTVDQAAQLGHKSSADAVQDSTGCSSVGSTPLDVVDKGIGRSKPCLPGDIWRMRLKSRKRPATHAKANMKSTIVDQAAQLGHKSPADAVQNSTGCSSLGSTSMDVFNSGSGISKPCLPGDIWKSQAAQLGNKSRADAVQNSAGCSSLGSTSLDVVNSGASRSKPCLPGDIWKSQLKSRKRPATHANANLKSNIVDQEAQLGHKSPADAVQNSTGSSSLGSTPLDVVDNGTGRSKPCLPGDIWKSQLKSRKRPATHSNANLKSNIVGEAAQHGHKSPADAVQNSTGCSSLGKTSLDVVDNGTGRSKPCLPGDVWRSQLKSRKRPATHTSANLKSNIVDQAAEFGHKSPADAVQNSTGCSSLGSKPLDVVNSDDSRLKLHLPGKILKKIKMKSRKLPATHANANLKRNIVDQAAQLGHKSPADAVQNSTGFQNSQGCSSLGSTPLDVVNSDSSKLKLRLPRKVLKRSKVRSRRRPTIRANLKRNIANQAPLLDHVVDSDIPPEGNDVNMCEELERLMKMEEFHVDLRGLQLPLSIYLGCPLL